MSRCVEVTGAGRVADLNSVVLVRNIRLVFVQVLRLCWCISHIWKLSSSKPTVLTESSLVSPNSLSGIFGNVVRDLWSLYNGTCVTGMCYIKDRDTCKQTSVSTHGNLPWQRILGSSVSSADWETPPSAWSNCHDQLRCSHLEGLLGTRYNLCLLFGTQNNIHLEVPWAYFRSKQKVNEHGGDL